MKNDRIYEYLRFEIIERVKYKEIRQKEIQNIRKRYWKHLRNIIHVLFDNI